MAMRDEVRRERAKLKGKGVKAHLEYFWEYYKIQTALAVIAAALVIGFLYTRVTAKDTAFEAVLINSSAAVDTDTAVNGAGKSFAEYAGIDTSKYDCFIDNTLSLSSDRMSGQYDYTTIMKLAAQMAAQQIDVMVANPSTFQYYAQSSSFADLRKLYSEDELKKWKDEGLLWYVDGKVIEELEEEDAFTESEEETTAAATEESLEEQTAAQQEAAQAAAEAEHAENYAMPDPDSMGDPIPVGVAVTNAPYLKDNGFYGDTVAIAGIVVNTKHTDMAEQFLSYLFEEGS